MKKTLLITCLFSSCLATAQSWNELTETDFYNIQLAGKSLKTIIDTQGQLQNVEGLFGKALEREINTEFDYTARYVYNGFMVFFRGERINEVKLPRFEITNNQVSLVIKGVSVKIGDSINKLGLVKHNTRRDGSKSIVYTTTGGIDYHFISIGFDQSTKRITEIVYIIQT